MVRHNATDSALSVPVLLNEAQRASASGHLRYAKVMWDLAGEDPEQTLQQLVFGAKVFMTVAEVSVGPRWPRIAPLLLLPPSQIF